MFLLKGNITWTGYRDLFVAAELQRQEEAGEAVDGARQQEVLEQLTHLDSDTRAPLGQTWPAWAGHTAGHLGPTPEEDGWLPLPARSTRAGGATHRAVELAPSTSTRPARRR